MGRPRPILEVNGLVKNFGGLTALNNVSFSVGKGEVLGVVGPNGSGKTTAFNVITGYIKPDSGSVFFADEDITSLAPYAVVRKGLARTFQIVRIFKNLTAYENVKVAALSNAGPKEGLDARIREALELVGLEQKTAERAFSLPMGDMKRLEIARALATGPSVLLLDEPFSGLSHGEVAEIARLLKSLIQRGLTVIIVEHVLRELKMLAEQVIVLDFGEKIAEGSFEDVMRRDVVREAYLGGA